MIVQCIGSGDAFGSGGRLNTCFFVQTAATVCLLDCGASALCGLKRQGIAGAAVEAVLLTHLHGDHFGGLPFFIREGEVETGRSKPLMILGPAGTQRRIEEALQVFFPSTGRERTFPVNFIEYTPNQPLTWQELTIFVFPAVHKKGSSPHSLRIECSEGILAYSGDTEWNGNIPALCRDADLLFVKRTRLTGERKTTCGRVIC